MARNNADDGTLSTSEESETEIVGNYEESLVAKKRRSKSIPISTVESKAQTEDQDQQHRLRRKISTKRDLVVLVSWVYPLVLRCAVLPELLLSVEVVAVNSSCNCQVRLDPFETTWILLIPLGVDTNGSTVDSNGSTVDLAVTGRVKHFPYPRFTSLHRRSMVGSLLLGHHISSGILFVPHSASPLISSPIL